jgi:hypothetical protein
MIQKIQALQRRLISKTEEAVEKDMLIRVGAGRGGFDDALRSRATLRGVSARGLVCALGVLLAPRQPAASEHPSR